MNDFKSISMRMVEEIEDDLCDRSGLKREFGKIDPDVKEEIREAWRAIVHGHVDPLETLIEELGSAVAALLILVPEPDGRCRCRCGQEGLERDTRAKAIAILEKAGLR